MHQNAGLATEPCLVPFAIPKVELQHTRPHLTQASCSRWLCASTRTTTAGIPLCSSLVNSILNLAFPQQPGHSLGHTEPVRSGKSCIILYFPRPHLLYLTQLLPACLHTLTVRTQLESPGLVEYISTFLWSWSGSSTSAPVSGPPASSVFDHSQYWIHLYILARDRISEYLKYLTYLVSTLC